MRHDRRSDIDFAQLPWPKSVLLFQVCLVESYKVGQLQTYYKGEPFFSVVCHAELLPAPVVRPRSADGA